MSFSFFSFFSFLLSLISYLLSRISNLESRISNLESRISNHRSRILDLGSWISDVGSRRISITNLESRIWKLLNLEFRISITQIICFLEMYVLCLSLTFHFVYGTRLYNCFNITRHLFEGGGEGRNYTQMSSAIATCCSTAMGACNTSLGVILSYCHFIFSQF